jgi:hypothetical protein
MVTREEEQRKAQAQADAEQQQKQVASEATRSERQQERSERQQERSEQQQARTAEEAQQAVKEQEEKAKSTMSAQVSGLAPSTVVDASALPSNVQQMKEAYVRQVGEYIDAPAYKGAFPVADDGKVYPPAISEADIRVSEVVLPELIRPPTPVMSERTKKEMERGKKAVGLAGQASTDRNAIREQAKREADQLRAAKGAPGVGDQVEAKYREAVRRNQTWGEGDEKVKRVLEHPFAVYREDLPPQLAPEVAKPAA